MIEVVTDLDYLIDHLRLHIHDITEPYEFSSVYLRTSLVYALKALGYRWNNRYLIDDSYAVTRNTLTGYIFVFTEPPVIQPSDEIIIVLQASIMIKMGRNRSSAANVASWRDSEITYSNIAASRAMSEDLNNDIMWLNNLLPIKRLFKGGRQALPGFESNIYEDTPGLE